MANPDPVQQGRKSMNDAWSIVQDQWNREVKIRTQQLQSLVNAYAQAGR
jgi:hypothetical protein